MTGCVCVCVCVCVGGGSYGPEINFCAFYYFRLRIFDRYFFLIV